MPAALLAAFALALGCGPSPASSSERDEAPSWGREGDAAPRSGGVVLDVDGHVVELVVHTGGRVVLIEHRPRLGLRASAAVTTADGLSWIPLRKIGHGVFVGHSAAPRTGPVEVVLARGDRFATARGELRVLVELPEHGGSVVVMGRYHFEVVARSRGRLSVYALGGPHHGIAGRTLFALVRGADRQMHPLTLRWRGEAYEGQLRGSSIQPGPVALSAPARATEPAVTGRGVLVAGAPSVRDRARVPTDFRLPAPQLGTTLPRTIAVPPATREPDGAD